MADVAENKKTGGKKKRRPDGTDPAQYKYLEDLRYTEWAWEFLRRNDEYIAECKRVDSCNPEEKREVANEFGLKEFKRYSERYKEGSGIPRFNFGSITHWINLNRDNIKGRQSRIRICPGQVVVRFNLASMIEDKKVTEKQLRLAKQVITKNLAVYEKLINKEAKIHKFKCMNFGLYIRLLDCLASKKTPLECSKFIYPNKGIDLAESDLNRQVKDPIKAARNIASEGYLYLSTLKGKPKGHGIILTS